ncbi:MAG: GAF domain-containing protein [Calditrichia bacterium]
MTKKNKLQEDFAGLQEEKQRLEVLLHLAQNLQTHLELEDLLLTTMEEVGRILQADRCSVFLLDEEKHELWSIVALGVEKGREIRFPADKGIAGYVAMTGENLNIENAYEDPRFNPGIDQQTGYRTQSVLTMPLSSKTGDTIGIVQVLNKRNGIFTSQDEELLNAISQIAATTIENSILYQEQVESLNSFVETLAATLDTRDYITAGHSRRVTLYTTAMCRQMGMQADCCKQLRYAGLLHDIGKLGIPEAVLFKAGKLDNDEYEIIKKHPAITREILDNMHFPRNLKAVPDIASTHHEKINGDGYPNGLKADEIPLGGRILALADVFDALTSTRQYHDREPIETVWDIIEREKGETFDPDVIDIFLRIPLKKIIEILEFGFTHKFDYKELSRVADVPFRKIIEIKGKGAQALTAEEQTTLNVFDKYYQKSY